ncbi:hypothetical protein BpHYR1_046727 [Brachionus plicatilis]|uniref:Uncharacterized protein n=1 Tax=Brachionus plicatilis TaxID=10195 RepID=A0A3M7SEL0_BRAPC|nr:hypothetical protein BpHYR1_046727 [Brachionus plicatilis]
MLEGNSIAEPLKTVISKMTITPLTSLLPPTGHRTKKTPRKITTKPPIVIMGRNYTQSGETSESESEMVEGWTICTQFTKTHETVTTPVATTSLEATTKQINVPGCSNQNDLLDEEPEEEEEDFMPPKFEGEKNFCQESEGDTNKDLKEEINKLFTKNLEKEKISNNLKRDFDNKNNEKKEMTQHQKNLFDEKTEAFSKIKMYQKRLEEANADLEKFKEKGTLKTDKEIVFNELINDFDVLETEYHSIEST